MCYSFEVDDDFLFRPLASKGACMPFMLSMNVGPLSSRLLKFRDETTPLGAAVWASNSIEIFCGRRPGQAYLIGCSFGCSRLALQYACSWLAGEADGVMTKDLIGVRFEHVLWFNVIFLGVYTVIGWSLLRAAWEGAVGVPSLAAAYFSKSISVGGVLCALCVLAEVTQIVSGLHRPGWTIRQSFAPDGIAFISSIQALWSLFLWCLSKWRGDLFVPIYLGTVVLCSGFFWQKTCSSDDFTDSFRSLLFQFCCLVTFASLAIVLVSGFRAWMAAQEQCNQMRRFWVELLDAPPEAEALASDDVIRREQVHRLSARTETVLQHLRSEFISARAAAPNLARWLPSRTDEYGRFSAQGKCRQQTSDLDALYRQASLLDGGALHLLLQQILEPLPPAAKAHPILIKGPLKNPERAMEKCVRSYGRDARQLTDLVRFSVIAMSFEQLINVFCTFCDVSAIGPDSKPPSLCPPSGAAQHGRAKTTTHTSATGAVWFRMTGVKNRFDPASEHFDFGTGFKGLALNLEVGWCVRGDEIEILPVAMWDLASAQQHIFEVQIHLEGWYRSSKSPEMRAAYRRFRDLLSQ